MPPSLDRAASAPLSFEEYAAAQGYDMEEAYRVIGAARRIARESPPFELTDAMVEAFVEAGIVDREAQGT